MPEHYVFGRPIVLILWLMTLFIGRLATLVVEADKVFLLPKESQMNHYLKRAFQHSIWLPLVTLFMITGIAMPLVVVSTGWDFSTFFFFFGMLVLLKLSHLLIQKHILYQLAKKQESFILVIWLLICLLTIGLSLYTLPVIGLVCSLIQLVVFYRFLANKERTMMLDWEQMIQMEKDRIYRIYQFVHLFTDVPEISSSVKRRKYLDFLLGKVSRKTENTYFYLYARSFLRGSEYSGLFLRLVLVGGIVVLMLKEFFFSMGIAALFIYLIGFQLIPIYAQYNYMVMTHLYPISASQKTQAVNQLITLLLLVATVIFSLLAFITLPNKLQALGILIVLMLEVVVFTKLYVPYRLKKMEG